MCVWFHVYICMINCISVRIHIREISMFIDYELFPLNRNFIELDPVRTKLMMLPINDESRIYENENP